MRSENCESCRLRVLLFLSKGCVLHLFFSLFLFLFSAKRCVSHLMFFFFFSAYISRFSAGIGGCRRYGPIRPKLARINPIPHTSADSAPHRLELTRIAPRKKKRTRHQRTGSNVAASDAGAAGVLPHPCIPALHI